jgi:hypothetical protein
MSEPAPVIIIKHPKILSVEDFKSIQGSPLHAQMMKNRSMIETAGWRSDILRQ